MAIPVAAVAGLALTAASGIGNAISGNKYRKKLERRLELNRRKAENDLQNDLYDATQSATAQRAATQADKAYQEGVNAVGSAVTGGGLQRAKMLDSVNKARAEQASAISAQGDQMRAAAKQNYRSRVDAIDNAEVGLMQQQAENSNAAWGSLGQAGAQISSMDAMRRMYMPNGSKPSDATTNGGSSTAASGNTAYNGMSWLDRAKMYDSARRLQLPKLSSLQ